MTTEYDYIIVGAGMAGLQLAKALLEDTFFKSKSILIIESHEVSVHDKTWCFWEKNSEKWNQFIYKKWSKTRFRSIGNNLEFELKPYTYKMIQSRRFSDEIRSKIEFSKNIKLKFASVTSINKNTVVTKDGQYKCKHIFDSRIPKEFKQDSKKTLIHQHFKGYFIKTKHSVFNEKVFTIMDYSVKHDQTTSFTYILPFSEHEALIEYTFFSPETVDDPVYDKHLKNYITTILKVNDYEIVNIEKGNIPMTDYPFHHHNNQYVTKIGTAGGWIKSSSGYGFKHSEKKIKIIVENLKKGLSPNHKLFSKKHRWYDKIFLKVLFHNNHLGESIFTKFYKKNDIGLTFKFLDEETNFYDDFKIICSLISIPFIKALFK